MTDSAATLNRGVLLVLGSILVGVSMDALAKHLTAFMAVGMLVWSRYFGHALLMVVWALGTRRLVWRTTAPWLQWVRSVLLVASTAQLYAALVHLPLSTTAAIGMVHPLITTALAVPILGEVVGWRRWCAVLVGLVGAVIIIRPSFEVLGWPVLLPLGMAFGYASYTVATRALARVDSSATTFAWTPVAGAIAATLYLPWGWQTPQTTAEVGQLLMLGVLGATAHLLYVMALRLVPAGVIGAFSYSGLVWAGLLGFVLFAEVPDRWTLLGAGLIAGSGLYVWARERRRIAGT